MATSVLMRNKKTADEQFNEKFVKRQVDTELGKLDSGGVDDRGGGAMMQSVLHDQLLRSQFKLTESEELVGGEVKTAKAVTVDQKVKVLLMASSFGRTLAADLLASNIRTHLVKGAGTKTQHVTKALLEVNGVPVINHWLAAFRKSERLRPLDQAVYILCNETNQEEIVDWATDPFKCQFADGFPVSHIISNGMSSASDARQEYARDIAIFLEKTGWEANPTHLFIIDTDLIVNPYFSMNGILEHSVVIGKDTLCYHPMHAAVDSTELHHILELEAGAKVMPKIKAFLTNPARGTTASRSIVGPAYFLRRTTVPRLRAWIAAESDMNIAQPQAAWGHFLSSLITGPDPLVVHGVEVPHVFDVLTVHNLMYVDGLMGHMSRARFAAQMQTRVSDTDSSLDFKTAFSGNQAAKVQEHSKRENVVEERIAEGEAKLHARQLRGFGEVSVDADAEIAEFDPRFEVYLEKRMAALSRTRGAHRDVRGPATSRTATGPFYLTSNSIYGSGRSTVSTYGLNIRSEGVLSPSRGVDAASEFTRSGGV